MDLGPLGASLLPGNTTASGTSLVDSVLAAMTPQAPLVAAQPVAAPPPQQTATPGWLGPLSGKRNPFFSAKSRAALDHFN